MEPAVLAITRVHHALGRAVEHARPRFFRLHTSTAATRTPPERGNLVPVLESTAALASGLASLLDAIDRALGNEGAEASAERISFDEARILLSELEPLTLDAGRFHPSEPRRRTVIGELPSFYGCVLGISDSLGKEAKSKSFALGQTTELWAAIMYLGGTHASGGLLARLDVIHQFPGVRKMARAKAYYPWGRDDIVGLGKIASRATYLAGASADAFASSAKIA